MNKELSHELKRRFSKHQNQGDGLTKFVVDLALQSYIAKGPKEKLNKGMDATFKAYAISQAKLLLFSGHDTTSSSICYILYILSTYPPALQGVRKEHKSILGSKLAEKAKLLEATPHLLNQRPDTIAVIKATMRLFPVVSSTAGVPGFSILDSLGHSFPTENFLIWVSSQVVHRDPDWWPQPNIFLHESLLAKTGDFLHLVKGA